MKVNASVASVVFIALVFLGPSAQPQCYHHVGPVDCCSYLAPLGTGVVLPCTFCGVIGGINRYCCAQPVAGGNPLIHVFLRGASPGVPVPPTPTRLACTYVLRACPWPCTPGAPITAPCDDYPASVVPTCNN